MEKSQIDELEETFAPHIVDDPYHIPRADIYNNQKIKPKRRGGRRHASKKPPTLNLLPS